MLRPTMVTDRCSVRRGDRKAQTAVPQSAVEGAAGSAPAAAVAAEPAKKRKRKVAAAVHVHGRGAGRGRGLEWHGEPGLEDLHPSWKAKRRVQRQRLKAITKSIRQGPPTEVVEVRVGVVEA